jgi:hypothetical protein
MTYSNIVVSPASLTDQPGLEEGVRLLCMFMRKLSTFLHMHPSRVGGLSLKSVEKGIFSLIGCYIIKQLNGLNI